MIRTAALARQRLRNDLQARLGELSVQDGDPRVPPTSAVESAAGAAFTVTPVARYREGVQMLQTLTGPILAILRARAGDNLEPVKPSLVPSLYQRLSGQAAGVPAGPFRIVMWASVSLTELQAMRIDVSAKRSDQRWTLVRGKNLIQCHSCGGSVSGALGDRCPSCGTPCTGFEAGWRVLDITAA